MNRISLSFGICLIALFLLPVVGCKSAADEQREADQQLAIVTQQEGQAEAEAMKPLIGVWASDLSATLAENSNLSDEMLAAIKRDLESYPLSIEITDHDYISRSRMKTVDDKYEIQSVESGHVTLNLNRTGGVNEARQRKITVYMQQGNLIIETGTPFRLVCSRTAVGGR
jgi:hypothetical protein